MGKKTALYAEHLKLRAAMVRFGGWDMPLHYGSQIAEHHAVRRNAGMFDVSHMGVVDIKGAGARPFLRYLLANDIDKLEQPGKALYGCMLNEAGGIVDDLISYFVAAEHYRLVVNAATTKKDLQWIKIHAKNFGVQIETLQDYAMIAIQGPESLEKFSKAFPFFKTACDTLLPFHFIEAQNWFIARTGYTGEDGLEMIIPASEALQAWNALIAERVSPCGLGARDTLRLEAGLNLYGQDMDESVTPLESHLSWTLSFKVPDRHFIGRSALEAQQKQGVPSQLIGLILEERGVLRHDQKVWVGKQVVGWITSGTFSPTLKKAIAFARILKTDIAMALEMPLQYYVEIRGKWLKASQVEPPFYRRQK